MTELIFLAELWIMMVGQEALFTFGRGEVGSSLCGPVCEP